MAFFINNIKKLIKSDERCGQCNYVCNVIHFQHNFNNWTSGNNDIDKFIQDAQLSIHSYNDLYKAIEWIPYNRFHNIRYITNEEFGEVYANWIDGYIHDWNNEDRNWKRKDQDMLVIL